MSVIRWTVVSWAIISYLQFLYFYIIPYWYFLHQLPYIIFCPPWLHWCCRHSSGKISRQSAWKIRRCPIRGEIKGCDKGHVHVFISGMQKIFIIFLLWNTEIFGIPDINRCTCPLSHPLYHTPFSLPILEHLCIFHADYLEVFPLECLRQQCNQRGQNKIIKTNNKMTSGEQSSDVNLDLYVGYIICFPTYTVDSSFTINPNFTNAGISTYKYHIKPNSEDLF